MGFLLLPLLVVAVLVLGIAGVFVFLPFPIAVLIAAVLAASIAIMIKAMSGFEFH